MRRIQNCTVAVIGGAGFLGSHLINHLVDDRQCRVLVVDNLIAGRREFVHPKANFEHHDITGSESYLKRLFEKYECQFVFNYAAEPYVPASFLRPLHCFNTTAMGALQVINAAHESSSDVEAILQVSSAEIYGGTDLQHDEYYQHKLCEQSTIRPHSTYGAAKAAVDYYCQAAWKERGTSVIALRQFNCVGERETHPYVVTEIISQLAKYVESRPYADGKTWQHYHPNEIAVVKLGNNSFRDFMYAGDAVQIAVELLEHGTFGEVYNLGSESGIKIYDLAKKIGQLMGFSSVEIEADEDRKRPWEIWHLQSDNSKIRDLLKLPDETGRQVTLDEALRRTIAWYNDNGRRWPWES